MDVAQRYSKKRQAIYTAMLQSYEHPSAEIIYQTLKPEYPDLSLGTVYRNIKSMVANGDVICVGNVDGKERYDAHIHPHAHLICTTCGTVVDLDIDPGLTEQCRITAQEHQVQLDLRSLNFTGLCQDCKDREAPDLINQ